MEFEKEKINELYDFVISHDDLTTNDLRNLDFSYRNRRKLIDSKVLERVKIGHYRLIDYSGILAYGRELLKKEDPRAWDCFDKAHEINPIDYENSSYFFGNKLYERDFRGAYDCLKSRITYKNMEHYTNLNFILLSHLIKLPDDDCDYVKYFDFDDVVIGKAKKDKRYIEVSNQVRFDIVYGYLEEALENIHCIKNTTINDNNTYKLLCAIHGKNYNISTKINKMIKKKEYQNVIALLEKEQKYHTLMGYHDAILSLCYDIINMKENKKPISSEGDFFDIYGNIYGHNYELAKQMIDEKDQRNNSISYSMLYSLLDECINLRDYTDKADQGAMVNYFTLAFDLYGGDYDSFFDGLHFHLYSIGMLQHEDKFTQLVELYKKEDDKSCLIPMKYLELIQGDDSPPIRNFFIDKFNNSVKSNDSMGAGIYFDIISQFDNNINDEKPYQISKKNKDV